MDSSISTLHEIILTSPTLLNLREDTGMVPSQLDIPGITSKDIEEFLEVVSKDRKEGDTFKLPTSPLKTFIINGYLGLDDRPLLKLFQSQDPSEKFRINHLRPGSFPQPPLT